MAAAPRRRRSAETTPETDQLAVFLDHELGNVRDEDTMNMVAEFALPEEVVKILLDRAIAKRKMDSRLQEAFKAYVEQELSGKSEQMRRMVDQFVAGNTRGLQVELGRLERSISREFFSVLDAPQHQVVTPKGRDTDRFLASVKKDARRTMGWKEDSSSRRVADDPRSAPINGQAARDIYRPRKD